MGYEAVIFDLDGVLCSTDEYHYLAWKSIAEELGVPFDRRINDKLRGVSRMDSLEIILEGDPELSLSGAEKEDLAQRKNHRYRTYLEQMTPADLPEEVSLVLRQLRAKGIKLAVGSSSKNAPLILEKIGLETFFDAVADGNQITRSKPDPEVFLKAAALLGKAPACCLVVEDAPSGAQAGHRGGMDVACVGPAAEGHCGDYNLKNISELLTVV